MDHRVKHKSSSKPRRLSKTSDTSESSTRRRVKRGSKPRRIKESEMMEDDYVDSTQQTPKYHHSSVDAPRRIKNTDDHVLSTPKPAASIDAPRRIHKTEKYVEEKEETDIEKRKKLEHAKYEEKYGIELDDSDVLRIKNKRAQYEKPLTETGAKVKDKDEIKQFLEGYKKIDPNELGTIECGSFIRYIKPDGVLCKGGTLTKNCSPKYWMLTNSKLKKTWSVQLQPGYKYYTVDKEKQKMQRSEADNIYNKVKNKEVDIIPKGDFQQIMEDYYRMKKILGEKTA